MAELSQTAANVLGTAHDHVTAGATITAGMPVYADTADANEYKASMANALATAKCNGIALNGASNGQPLTIQRSGEINLGATLVVGETYVVSDATAGKIRPLADLGAADYPVILGVAKTASILKLSINAPGIAKP
jgi:hypothetical protein